MYRIFLIVLFFSFICSFSLRAEEIHTKAIGDRVNVRARPNADGELVTQLALNEDVIVLEEQPEWIKIKAPSHSKCWVQSSFIDNGVINKEAVNLRCGPGTAYPILAQMPKGTAVKILEIFNDWTKVEPPVDFGVWVSAKYLAVLKKEEVKEEVKEQPIEEKVIEEQPVLIDEQTVSETETQKVSDLMAGENSAVSEVPQGVAVPESEMSDIELVSFVGKLEDMGVIVNRPGTYKLISEKGKWICIVRSPTLEVNSYVGKIIRVECVILSKTSTWNVPVVELKRVTIIK
jgi:uncharacterized protein YgiM (DUF1202 family)